MPRWRPVFNGTPGQGISSNIGEGNAPRTHSFAIEIRIRVPVKTPESFAWLAAFSAGEALSQDGEAGTLAAGWTTDGDLRVTVYGASLGAWRRLTIPGHVEAYAGKVVTLRIVRDAVAGTLTVEQDGEALEGDETTSGTAPDWDADIQASWLHVCGAKDQPGISAGYVGSVYAAKYTIHSFRNEAVLWLDAAHVDSDSAPQALTNRGGQKGTVGDAQFGSASGADTNDPVWLTGSGYVYLPGVANNDISTPNAAAQALTGDFRIITKIRASDYTPGMLMPIAQKRNRDTTSATWQLRISSTGALQLSRWVSGSEITYATSPLGLSDGSDIWLRVTFEQNTGMNSRATFETSTDGATWTVVATPTNAETGATTISSGDIVLGSGRSDGTFQPFAGRIYHFELQDGSGNPVARFDASQCGQTGYTDSINSTAWTVNRSTSGYKAVVVERPLLLFGSDDYLKVADNDLLDFGAGQAFTVYAVGRAWPTLPGFGRFFMKGTIPPEPGWGIYGNDTSLQLRGYASPGTSNTSAIGPTFSAGDLLSLVLRRGPTGDAEFGFVGSPFVAIGDSQGSLSNNYALHISSNSVPASYQTWEFIGLAIFRRALTDAELVALEREMLWEYGPTVLEWDFSTPQLTLPDLSGNGLDGAIAGASWSDGSTLTLRGMGYQRVIEAGDLAQLPFDAGDLELPILSYRYRFDAGDNAGAQAWFELEVAERIKRPLDDIPGTQSEDRSHVYEQPPAAETVDDYRLSVVFTSGPGTVVFRSLTPDIATVDQSGYVTGQDAGIALIEAECLGVTRTIQLEIERAVTTPSRFAVGFVEGSVARAIHDEVTSRLEGKSPATALKIFTTQNHSAGVYVRNPDCWAAGYDLTCASPWNSYGGNTRAGTLVTLRHLIWARHYDIPVGTTIRFVGMDNSVHDRVLLAKRTVPASYVPDLVIGVLDEDLPSDKIRPATVLPADFQTQIPITERIPMLCLDQEEKAILQYWGGESGDKTLISWIHGPYVNPVLDPPLEPFWEEPIGGDSGNACGLMLPEGFCILTVFHTPIYGSSIRYYATVLNSLISELDAAVGISTGYQLTPANLSTYTSYV